MKNKLIQLAGWYGVVAILAGYAAVNLKLLPVESFAYQALNVTGAIGIIAEAWSKKDYQPMFLNAVWALVAIAVLLGLR